MGKYSKDEMESFIADCERQLLDEEITAGKTANPKPRYPWYLPFLVSISTTTARSSFVSRYFLRPLWQKYLHRGDTDARRELADCLENLNSISGRIYILQTLKKIPPTDGTALTQLLPWYNPNEIVTNEKQLALQYDLVYGLLFRKQGALSLILSYEEACEIIFAEMSHNK